MHGINAVYVNIAEAELTNVVWHDRERSMIAFASR